MISAEMIPVTVMTAPFHAASLRSTGRYRRSRRTVATAILTRRRERRRRRDPQLDAAPRCPTPGRNWTPTCVHADLDDQPGHAGGWGRSRLAATQLAPDQPGPARWASGSSAWAWRRWSPGAARSRPGFQRVAARSASCARGRGGRRRAARRRRARARVRRPARRTGRSAVASSGAAVPGWGHRHLHVRRTSGPGSRCRREAQHPVVLSASGTHRQRSVLPMSIVAPSTSRVASVVPDSPRA